MNEDLLQAAFRLTKDVDLVDSNGAKAYRAKYSDPAATAPPQVSICDTISSDTWWFGARLAEAMAAYAKLITDGEANPCTTQQEDNATLTALKRGADAALLDFNRIAILRTAADFDREPPGQDAAEIAVGEHRRLPSLARQRPSRRRQGCPSNRRRLGDMERRPPETGRSIGPAHAAQRLSPGGSAIETSLGAKAARNSDDGGSPGSYFRDVLRVTVQWPLNVCAVRRRRFPVGASPTRRTLQPEATGAVMEVTKWLKPSV